MRIVQWIALAWAAFAAPAALAQPAADFPAGNVRLVVPFAAGGPTDVVARILGELLSARWGGKPVVIENRPGAGTIVATSAVAKSLPDGHSLLVATNSLLINPAIAKSLPYDTAKDLAPVTMIAVQPVALVASRSYAAATVAEVVARAKKEPVNYTSPGPRGVGDLAGQMLKQRAGIPEANFTHINYNGSAPALTDVIAGRVPLMFDIWHSARRYVESGELKLIASASAERLPGAESVPTIAETYPGVEVIAFNAIMAAGGTPAPIIEKLSVDIRAVVVSETFKDKTKNLGINVYGNTPAELSAWMTREIARWKEVAAAANIKAE
ncbi:MAG: tripartite tricarboxylate transporter substrate-binding protein [Alphaproteobacteria bacterium]|nr:tripartite tricarboxylate transporter substrate-binding protein [Alphaproteobacteria bacterium]